jgi:hypothetical protein
MAVQGGQEPNSWVCKIKHNRGVTHRVVFRHGRETAFLTPHVYSKLHQTIYKEVDLVGVPRYKAKPGIYTFSIYEPGIDFGNVATYNAPEQRVRMSRTRRA